MDRRAFFRTVAAAAVVAPVVPTTRGAYPGFAPALPAAVPSVGLMFHPAAFSAVMASLGESQRLYNHAHAQMAEAITFHVGGFKRRGQWGRLTLADIRGYGPPERLPA